MSNTSRNKRTVNGVLLLDKPAGMTSNQCLQRAKRLFQARKAGHTGSLDKPATGLLPLCFGEATKFSGLLLNADKEYLATCRLGVQTTTGDADGEIISTLPVPRLTSHDIEKFLDRFKGEITQVPPMYSALKQDGQRLYKLAYQGVEVERAPRKVHIYELELLEFNHDSLQIRVFCSKGTYIRTLVEDIGNAIGCKASIMALRRTHSGPFSSETMVTLEQLEHLAERGIAEVDSTLLPIDSLLVNIPDVHLTQTSSHYISQGSPVTVPGLPVEGMVRIYSDQDVLLGLGEVRDDGRLAPKRMISRPELGV